MKANANVNILNIFDQEGIHIDASSSYEVRRALAAGIADERIQLSSQQMVQDMSLLSEYTISFVATSLAQLEKYGAHFPGSSVWIRINPWCGSGAFAKISTGWVSSSFGIWYEYLEQVRTIAKQYGLRITKLHVHIGSENTAEAWADSASKTLIFAEQFPEVDTLNLWWWFKIAIMDYEKTADLQAIGAAVKQQFKSFAERTWRRLHVEIEPGKYLVMNSAVLLSRVMDVVNTWSEGYDFLKLDTGMTELPRISMYGVQQEMSTYPAVCSHTKKPYVVVGHCCESGDLLTCALYDAERIETRVLDEVAIDDLVVVHSCGAYNASMSMKHYNSYPEAAEVLLRTDGSFACIRKRQEVQQIWENELRVV